MAPPSRAADPIGEGPARRTVLISYVPPDLMWAEWVSEQLQRAGVTVELAEWNGHPSTSLLTLLDRARTEPARCALLLSKAYLAGATAELAESSWNSVTPDVLIPLIVGQCQVPPPFWKLSAVSLHDAGDGRVAAGRLLDRILGPGHADEALAGPPDALTRFPSRRPRIWSRLVPLRNPHFTGREGLLRDLRDQLRTDATALHSLQGLGGVGKTQLATEYAYRFQADYDLVWWVPSEERAQARAALAELAPRLGLADNLETGEAIRAVLDVLRTNGDYRNWLLIFDNAERTADIADLMSDGPGQTLITTRNQGWADHASVLDVDVYRQAESVAFFRRRVPGLAEADAIRLATELGHLPLVLEHAAAWLRATRDTPDRYLELLEAQGIALFAAVQPTGYPKSVATTWTLSVDKVREENPAAATLLEACAFIGPNPIPLNLFTEAPEETLPEGLGLLAQDDGLRADALRLIQAYSLAKVSDIAGQGPSLQQHRFVQRMIRELVSGEQRTEYRTAAHSVLAAADPGDPQQRANLGRYVALLPHVRSSGMTASTAPEIRETVLNHALFLQRVQGELQSSLDLLNEAEAAWRGHLDDFEPDMFTLERRRANVLRSLGLLDEALAVDEASYGRAAERFGTDDPETVRAASGLAASARRLGQLRRARDLDEHILRVTRERHGNDHPATLQNAHNMALNYRISGDFESALQLDRENADRYDRLVGSDDYGTLFALNNVARDLRECGLYYESLALQEDTYARYRDIFGDESPETLRAMKNLAVTRRKAGRYAEALELATLSHERHVRKFGPSNLETLAAATNLANDHRCLGQYAAGRGIAETALHGYRTTHGEENMFTVMAAVNFATLVRLTGEHARARDLNTETLARLREIFTADHRYTLSCQVNLASDYAEAGDFETAGELGEDAFDRLRRVSGESHPYTLACGLNLALDLRSSGERAKFRELYTDVMERYESTLGPSHPETAAAQSRQRAVCDIEPPPT